MEERDTGVQHPFSFFFYQEPGPWVGNSSHVSKNFGETSSQTYQRCLLYMTLLDSRSPINLAMKIITANKSDRFKIIHLQTAVNIQKSLKANVFFLGMHIGAASLSISVHNAIYSH